MVLFSFDIFCSDLFLSSASGWWYPHSSTITIGSINTWGIPHLVYYGDSEAKGFRQAYIIFFIKKQEYFFIKHTTYIVQGHRPTTA